MKLCRGCNQPGTSTLCPACTTGLRDYQRAHQTVRTTRGSATKHACTCGAVAAQWAYNNACHLERTDTTGRRYCPHVVHYDPMCIPCHREMDAHRRMCE